MIFRFDNGKGHAHVRSDERIYRNQWNHIIASRNGQDGELILNDGVPKKKQSPGNLKQLNVDPVGYLGGLGEDTRPV